MSRPTPAQLRYLLGLYDPRPRGTGSFSVNVPREVNEKVAFRMAQALEERGFLKRHKPGVPSLTTAYFVFTPFGVAQVQGMIERGVKGVDEWQCRWPDNARNEEGDAVEPKEKFESLARQDEFDGPRRAYCVEERWSTTKLLTVWADSAKDAVEKVRHPRPSGEDDFLVIDTVDPVPGGIRVRREPSEDRP